MNRKILAISIIVFVIDQISKSVISTILDLGQNIEVVKDFFYISLIHNYGAAWSLFQDKIIFIIVGTFLALIVIYRYMYLFRMNMRNKIAFGLLTGGIIGNLIDRILYGYVVDFFNFYIFNYDFPIFNCSDIAIVSGVALLIYAILRGEDGSAKDKSGNVKKAA